MVVDGGYDNFLPLNLVTIFSWLSSHIITFALYNMIKLKKSSINQRSNLKARYEKFLAFTKHLVKYTKCGL
jgi:hypothetical protein